MSAYVDVETSAESIQEDEELIEAVEALVETAAVNVWTEIRSDLSDLRQHCRRIVERLFPIVIDYRNDPSRIRQDLVNLAIFFLLFTLSFIVLSPWQRQSSKKQRTMIRRFRSDSWSNHVDASSEEGSTPSFDRVDDETDEERFEKMWPSISLSRYRRLVLPPTCRIVQNPERKRKESVNNKIEAKDKEENDDDNPAARLQGYLKHFLHFLKSIISYDYTSAGWTLILWIRGIRRSRTAIDKQESPEEIAGEDSPLPATRQNSRTNSLRSHRSLSDIASEDEGGGSKRDTVDTGSLTSSVGLEPSDMERTVSRSDTVYHESQERSDKIVPKSVPKSPLVRSPQSRILRRPSLKHRKKKDDNSESSSPFLSPVLGGSAAFSVSPPLGPRSSSTSLDQRVPNLPSLVLGPKSEQVGIEQQDSARSKENFFFETAHSQSSLKQMSIEVPVPDKNGYILGDEFLTDSRDMPLLVFVNSRSGPQQGHLLVTQLRRLLNPIQIWDLSNGDPETVLESFLVFARLRILVCGGDGTVSWIVSALERMKVQRKWPPIAILPLGTGNDLARIHGWGGGFNNESLVSILEQISESYISLLDRWEVTIDDKKAKKTQVKDFFNYLGVGADAQAALQVHYLRESRPEWFFSRMVNKAWYGVFGAEDLIMASSVNVRKEIKLLADGVEVPLPSDSQGIILLNIDSYAGGVPLWSHGTKGSHLDGRSSRTISRRAKSMQFSTRGRSLSMDRTDSLDDISLLLSEEDRFDRVTACDRPSSCQDGLLEIVSIRGAFHLGQIKVGLSNAQRLCQCREATITIKNKVAVQVDGEPWRQKPCTLHIKRKQDPAIMLHRSVDDGGVETEMSKLLDWAEERQLIDGEVHTILMKEFSRRIESKTRRRRFRAQDNIMHTLKKAISQGAMANMQGSQNWNGGISF